MQDGSRKTLNEHLNSSTEIKNRKNLKEVEEKQNEKW